MSSPLTNIRVFVQWTEQTVFAGEDIECEITFKNIATAAPTSAPARASLHPPTIASNGFVAGGDRQRKPPLAQGKNSSVSSPRARSQWANKGHRSTLSLNVSSSSTQPHPPPDVWNAVPRSGGNGGKGHHRSVSVLSIGASDNGILGDITGQGGAIERPRASKGHGRAASLQIVSRRHGVGGGPPSAPIGQRSSTHPSPLLVSSFSPLSKGYNVPDRFSKRQSGAHTAPTTPNIGGRPGGASTARRKTSELFPQEFKFPSVSSPSADDRASDNFNGNGIQDSQENAHLLSPQLKEAGSDVSGNPAQVARVLSPTSVLGTPRSSGEFYSLSNNSSETLASEYVSQPAGRTPLYGSHSRKLSTLAPVNHHRPPEALMMGYAQIYGSFTLDGSLISQAPFEEVKRKGAVGGQGGGVIGVESKRDSSLLRGFGWNNIGESLGGLLGGGELSSIKDMRGIASSRSIPVLSTPQSILFVDLKLAPGESRSYKYSFKLPRGLPPSHRGKAIKISYKLIIGIQRPGGAKEQKVKSVEIPFRILGSVNSHGEVLGHDLMSPYIILRDQARVKVLDSPPTSTSTSQKRLGIKATSKLTQSTLEDFISYVDELISRPQQNPNLGLLSPTEGDRRQSSIPEPASVKETIDMAILRSNITTEAQQSANRFEIARSGKKVAVVMLARPAYRLGESITAVIDFTDAEIPCYAIHMALEASEKVDSAIALRSEASILRVTRKVHVSHSESTLFARRVVFSPTIPISATPEFITSGVSLEWRIRIEFVTPRLSFGENEIMPVKEDLLEEISRDDRGTTLASTEVLDCESFEIAVPIKVYGALAGNTERDELLMDGLVV